MFVIDLNRFVLHPVMTIIDKFMSHYIITIIFAPFLFLIYL